MGKKSSRRRKLTKHHRLPRSLGGTDTYPEGNIALLRNDRHQWWHALFGNFDAQTICRLINQYYIDPRFEVVLRRRT